MSAPQGRFRLISALWTPVGGKGAQVDFQPGSSLHGPELGWANSRFWGFKVIPHGISLCGDWRQKSRFLSFFLKMTFWVGNVHVGGREGSKWPFGRKRGLQVAGVESSKKIQNSSILALWRCLYADPLILVKPVK